MEKLLRQVTVLSKDHTDHDLSFHVYVEGEWLDLVKGVKFEVLL